MTFVTVQETVRRCLLLECNPQTIRYLLLTQECGLTDPSLVPRPHPRGEGLVLIPQEVVTNLHPKKVLCHCAEVAKDFRCCTADCIFCNVIGG